MGLTYQEGKKKVFQGFGILLLVTLIEVAIAIVWKVILGAPDLGILNWWFPLVMMALSAYKAYFIVSEFMHMKYEKISLTLTVIVPLVLLVWAIIAFLWEGGVWKKSREKANTPIGLLIEDLETSTTTYKI